jgi:tetratricopeptide (TPR) repeat protein
MRRPNGLPFQTTGIARPAPQGGPLVLKASSPAAGIDKRTLMMLLDRGREAHRQGDLKTAVRCFNDVLKVMPDQADAHFGIAMIELDVNRPRRAAEHIEKALRRGSHIPAVQFLASKICMENAELAKAAMHIKKVLELQPESDAGFNQLALIMEQAGRLDESRDIARAAIARNPDNAGAIACLARSMKFNGDEPEIAIMEKARERATDTSKIKLISYALGKIYNDCNNHDAAFANYEKANSLVTSAEQNYKNFVQTVNETKALFTGIKSRLSDGAGNRSEAPVFIVGMPRSGTTLTEQILAAHPAIVGVGEQDAIRRILTNLDVREGRRDGHFAALERADATERAALGETYLNSMRRFGAADRYVDKMPHNFMQVGFIRLIFPHARIVHCLRNPIDTCLSCFMSPLNDVHAYAKDLRTLGLYYREYHALMAFWRDDMGIEMFEMPYEETVADVENRARALVAFTGMPWDEKCLSFHQAESRVTTISKWQVRQPVYTSSVLRWKAYERHLGPLIEALGDLAQ